MNFKDHRINQLFIDLLIARDDYQMALWTKMEKTDVIAYMNEYYEHEDAFIAYVESKIEGRK